MSPRISLLLPLCLAIGCSSLGAGKDDAPEEFEGGSEGDGGSGDGSEGDGGSEGGGSGDGGSGDGGSGDGGSGGSGSGGDGGPVDEDGDGYDSTEDCDDRNASVNPGATETPYNDTDDDCDASTPDDDLDGDGFGVSDDCNDTDSSVNPGAEEVRGDGVDNDCDPATCHASGFASAETVYALPSGLSSWDQPFDAVAGPDYCTSGGSGRPGFGVLDIDADGTLDFVTTTDCSDDTVGEGAWNVYPGGTSGFSASPTSWTLPSGLSSWDQPFDDLSGSDYCSSGGSGRPGFFLSDLDADGQVDFVTATDCSDASVGEDTWQAYLGGSSGFSTSGTDWALPPGLSTWDQPFDASAGSEYCYYSSGTGRPGFATFDLTGDGYPDFITTTDCTDEAVGETHWNVYEGSSSGFSPTPTTFTLPSGIATWDQPFDALSGSDYCYSGGTGRPGYALLDLTGDGLADFVTTTNCSDDAVGATRWEVYENTGSRFSATATAVALPSGIATWDTPFDAVSGSDYCTFGTGRPGYTVFDLTGDGHLDFVTTTSCADDTVGVTRWQVYEGSTSGFAYTATDWSLPSGLSTWTLPYDAIGGSDYCYSGGTGRPGYALLDLTGDGRLDFVATTSCSDDAVGETKWDVYVSECDL